MKTRALLFTSIWLSLLAIAQAQMAPPYLTSVSPLGVRRGARAVLTIEGYNLTDASEVIWNKPGLTGSIILNSETAREKPRNSLDPTKKFQGDRGTRNRVQVELFIEANAEPGIYTFRLKTPLGTSSTGRIYVGALRETAEKELNDAPDTAQPVSLPTAVAGEMQHVGDTDHFKFNAKTGQQIVFQVIASAFGSKLDSLLTLLDANGQEVANSRTFARKSSSQRDATLAFVVKTNGEYTLRLTDQQKAGQPMSGPPLQFAYRLNIGELPFITGIYPLGVRQGESSELTLQGFNLDRQQLAIQAPAQVAWGDSLTVRPTLSKGLAYPSAIVAVGRTPEINESATKKSVSAPQAVSTPATINGRIADGEDYFRFSARKGVPLVLEVEAQRYGSPLDAVIEVYDAKGKLVPRALLRCVVETQQTLNDRDSATRGIRVLNWNGINVNDYVLIGNELLQVDVLPKGPDEDTFFKSFAGQRIGFLDTTPEAHAANTAMYKVSIHPPEAKLSPNGLPQVMLYYRNDDGGPMYGKDSRLTFSAPADGDYIVCIRDVRGLQGEAFAYRLTIREPAPDFVLSIDPENPNVPRGSSLPLTVTAFRTDGFEGDIEVKLLDLPSGITATTGTIRTGMISTVLLLTAKAEVNPATSCPLRVQGTAKVGARSIVREVRTAEKIAVVSVAAPPELLVWTDQERITLEPGGNAWVSIKIKREQGFQGRVPFDVRNLPHGVIVKDVGLSGVLITEEEETQRFELSAEPWVQAVELPIYVVGRIETSSPQRSEFPAKPLTLVIQPKQNASRTNQP